MMDSLTTDLAEALRDALRWLDSVGHAVGQKQLVDRMPNGCTSRMRMGELLQEVEDEAKSHPGGREPVQFWNT